MTCVDEIRKGVRLREAGNIDEARHLLKSLWQAVSKGDDAFAVCFLAHSLADVQDDPAEELRWDVVALKAAGEVTDDRAAEQQIPGGQRGLYPSLHLNLAEDYRRLGDEKRAQEHYRAGAEFVRFLADDSYGDRLREAFKTHAAKAREDSG
jgi:hypothetical protein